MTHLSPARLQLAFSTTTMSEHAHLQQKAMHSLQDSRRPLFLQTQGSVWTSTRIPIVAFAGYALGIYLLNLASLGTVNCTMQMYAVMLKLDCSSQLWSRGQQPFWCFEHDCRPHDQVS